ncbi:MAG: hypothetical protein L3K10_01535 [Thermoplasmata archaeon]|nr:hypothetical protein [Thermoplasmata archaeon]
MTADDPPLPVNPGLRSRFRSAGQRIEWTPAPRSPPRPKTRRGRMARLRDEQARVEEWGSERDGGVMVDSGPVGALVLLLALDRRGVPSALGAVHAGRDPAFPGGAIVAVWGAGPVPDDEHPRLDDVVELARFALE